jgi:hypothetical protein
MAPSFGLQDCGLNHIVHTESKTSKRVLITSGKGQRPGIQLPHCPLLDCSILEWLVFVRLKEVDIDVKSGRKQAFLDPGRPLALNMHMRLTRRRPDTVNEIVEA